MMQHRTRPMGSAPLLASHPPAARTLPVALLGKTGSLLALAALLLGTGCSQTYAVRLNNGQTLTAATKPKPDGHGYYVFKDPEGRPVKVNELRVREIEAQ